MRMFPQLSALARRSALRPSNSASYRLVTLRRHFVAPTLALRDAASASDDGASHASTSDFTMPYPEAKGRDVGHSTVGPGVGRHTSRTLQSLSMENKVCVVTGAARGLGNLFARTFVECGSDHVVIMDLDEKLAVESAKEMQDWFIQHGQAKPNEVDCMGLGVNVADENAVKAAFDKVVHKYGRIDVLVTSAGIVHNYPAEEYPTEKMRQLWGVNIDGTFFCAREAAKHMKARGEGGSILLVGSMSGNIVNIPQPQTPYNASKAAVHHMAASLAVEWAKHNIRVNALAPGYMATSLTRTILDANPVLRDTWTSLTPMQRIGEPEDLKGAVIYLCSDAAAFTTGTTLTVDGGYKCT